jgi:hypothetical protein
MTHIHDTKFASVFSAIFIFIYIAFTQNCLCQEVAVETVKLTRVESPDKIKNNIHKISLFMQENNISVSSLGITLSEPQNFDSVSADLSQMIMRASLLNYNENEKKTGQRKQHDVIVLFLMIIKLINDSINPEIDHNDVPISNMAPEINIRSKDVGSDKTWQIFICGMSPEIIQYPEIRQLYKKQINDNKKRTHELFIQQRLRDLLIRSQKSFHDFICNIDKADAIEYTLLIDLLEKYEYPMEERIKLLADLNIPYKGFRNWESTDKLFKATARFISLEKDEVNLEKANGKKTTIELAVLRKEDQDYVKKQLESEKKTVGDEKVKKD